MTGKLIENRIITNFLEEEIKKKNFIPDEKKKTKFEGNPEERGTGSEKTKKRKRSERKKSS